MRKGKFTKLVDKMCKLHPEGENYHRTKVKFCKEFLKTIRKMQGTELEPYLAEIKATPHDGCFNIVFKIPLVSYNELKGIIKDKNCPHTREQYFVDVENTSLRLAEHLKEQLQETDD